MGVVYRARDSRLGRAVAVKALPEHLAQDAERLARFEREARTLASLSHPNIAGIHGLEVHEGRRYLVLELVEGEPLNKRLERGPLALDEALEVCAQIAAGLEAAHEAGVVHRDLKPGNVMLTPEGKVKVLDFGLAKSSEQGASSSSGSSQSPTMTTPARGIDATAPGAILGTVPYMSPEQARGRKVDKRTDVWSFGCILYETLTGLGPFAGETASDSIGAILHKELDYSLLPPATPARVRELLKRMLERDRDNRLRDLGDAMLELQAARHEKGPAVGTGGPTGRSGRGVGAMAVVGAAMLALGAVVGFLLRGDRAAPVVPTPTVATPKDRLPGYRLAQVTDLAGVETFPVLSPDGLTVVYAARDDGEDWDLFSQRIGGSNPINLTPDADWDDWAPAFSPDGSQIAFRSERDGGGLFVMGATGESPRRVTSEGFDPRWSPDGAMLVYATEGITDPSARNLSSEVWAVRVSDGQKTRLCQEDGVQPSWSPSGARIAFWGLAPKGGQRDLYTVSAQGGERTPVLEDAATDWNPVWSPDGQWLYFCSNRGGNMGVWRVRIDEPTGKAQDQPELVTVAPGVEAGFLSLSRDGRRLALAASSVISTVFRLDIDPETIAPKGSARPLTRFTSDARMPSISPDGRQVAYMGGGTQEDIYIVRADGTGRRRVTSDAFKDRGPKWFDGGKEIVFYSDRGGQYALWGVRPDGGQLHLFAEGERGLTLPVISPDERRVTVSERGHGARLIEIGDGNMEFKDLPNPLKKEEVELLPTSWTPDGRRLLALAGRQGVILGVGAVTLDTGAWEWILKGNDLQGGVFCADGKRVLVVRRGRFLVVEPGQSEPRLVYEPEGSSMIFGAYVDLAPDGSWLCFDALTAEADIWVMEFEGGAERP